MRPNRVFLPLAAVVSIAFSCSNSPSQDDDVPDATAPLVDAGQSSDRLLLGESPGDEEGPPPEYHARVKGRVLAPEGTIPISGALVYLTSKAPDPIPEHTYCDACVPLPPYTPYDITDSDGTFAMKGPAGRQFLVVQKGAFRRVREIELADEATVDAPEDSTTLPSKNGDGDTIPKMAIIRGAFDHIQDTLAKLGLGQVDSNGTYVEGTGSFESYTEGTTGPLSQDALLNDPTLLSQYHVIFRPCSTCNDGYSSNPTVMSNLRDFVAAGGKLYVTDWSYEYVHQGWPDPVTFRGQSTFGGGCGGYYDAPVKDLDEGLGAWLTVNGVDTSNFKVTANFSVVESLNAVEGPMADGGTGEITPKAWVQGDIGAGVVRPNTISFEHGCGRVLFSTYHTEATFAKKLAPQELALLYVLLEVNVCVGKPIPKPPPN